MRFNESVFLLVVDRQIAALEDIHEGDILRGYIKSCSDVGVFVR